MISPDSLGAYARTDGDQWFGPERSIAVSFVRFHRENPEVYERLCVLARTWVEARPNTKLGIGMLFERLRWDLAIRTTGEPLKLNNNYRALYSRKMMREEADLEGLFETRRLRARA